MTAPRPLGILYVGTLPPYPGGSALSSAQLLAGFAQRGHRVRAVAPLTEKALAQGDAFAAAHPRLSVVRFSVPSFDFDHSNPAGAAYQRRERDAIRTRVRALIAAERSDTLMVGRESFALHLSDLALAAGIPFVLRAAGGLTTELLNGTLRGDLRRGLLAAYQRADLIVSPAAHLAERLRTDLGLQRVTTIRNAVDLRVFGPRPKPVALLRNLAVEKDAVVVLHASNLVACKRPLDIVAAAPAVLEANSRVVFVVVGDGPLREAMRRACRRRGVGEHFRFPGWVPYEDMPAFLNAADIVLHPAETETQARVYLEAQACGRCVLASDIAAAREVITDGKTGLLHRRGDIDDLCRQMLRLAGDAGWRARLGRQARIRVRAHDLRHAVDAYLAAMARLCASNGGLDARSSDRRKGR
jgi:glycosyltransferase involved in cell wall biosynthesis